MVNAALSLDGVERVKCFRNKLFRFEESANKFAHEMEMEKASYNYKSTLFGGSKNPMAKYVFFWADNAILED